MSKKISRRTMLSSTLAATAGFWVAPAAGADDKKLTPNEKLNIACIGVGGRGTANVKGVKDHNIVALCDVDQKRGGSVLEYFDKAKKFKDFRVMLDKMENEIDAVVVSTPDHTHFHPSMAAMERKKHLYCEKPMAHNVWEIRTMTEFAKKQGVATQLGCQRHTLSNMHRSVELIKANAIGKVSEVHCWVSGNRGMPKIPSDKPSVPETLAWDLWLGPAKTRAYHSTYCPYGWRFWWDFGTGETGNWGCHILDIPFWALDLKYPTRVDASGPPVHQETTPKSMSTKFRFEKEGVDLHWYHAKGGPTKFKGLGPKLKGMNTIFVGEKGILVTGFKKYHLLPEETFADFKTPEKTIPKSPGFHREWLAACKGGAPATCNFDYSGPLAETVILGNTAYRAGGGFDWDASNLKAKGNDKAQDFIREEYRKGWQTKYE